MLVDISVEYRPNVGRHIGGPINLRKQPTFGDATTGFPAKWRLRNKRRKSMTDDASLPRSWSCFWSVVPSGKFDSTNQKHNPDLGNDASSVWNFCAHFSDVIWRETGNSVAKCRLFFQAISGYTDVSPVAPTPFGFLLLLFLCVSVCVLYYKFILYITGGAPNKAVKKITITLGKCQLYI